MKLNKGIGEWRLFKPCYRIQNSFRGKFVVKCETCSFMYHLPSKSGPCSFVIGNIVQCMLAKFWVDQNLALLRYHWLQRSRFGMVWWYLGGTLVDAYKGVWVSSRVWSRYEIYLNYYSAKRSLYSPNWQPCKALRSILKYNLYGPAQYLATCGDFFLNFRRPIINLQKKDTGLKFSA